MGLGHAPSIVTNGLVLCLDAANYKSFKGVPATNILTQVGYNQSNSNTALYKYTQGTENVNIPSLGYVNSKFVDFYNDYNGGSGNCCPALFSYGTSLAVSPSTTYTYSIIYKTTTGYTHPNYMYRYERNSAGTVLTEAGVHSTNNRTSLGDGWWFAWGQFTTQATTATLNTFLFHYEYATQNRVYVYKAALYEGTYVIPPEHMLNSAEVRGNTVATGGGWADIIGNGNNGTLTNGPTYSSSNGGSLNYDGTNDYIQTPITGTFSQITFEFYGFFDDPNLNMLLRQESAFGDWTSNRVHFGTRWTGSNAGMHFNVNGVWQTTPPTYLRYGWNHYVLVYDTLNNLKRVYLNGILSSSHGTNGNMVLGDFKIGVATNLNAYYRGNISNFKIYNRALTEAEIQQNFNALRGRYGI